MADDPADALETPAERTHVRSRDISRAYPTPAALRAAPGRVSCSNVPRAPLVVNSIPQHT